MDPRALAAQLGLAIKETPEYLAVQSAREKVNGHEAAGIMWRDFQERQEKYRQALLEGKAGEEDEKELRRLGEIIGYNPYIRELLAAEARLAEMVVGLQAEMMKAAGLAEEPAGKEPTGNGKDN